MEYYYPFTTEDEPHALASSSIQSGRSPEWRKLRDAWLHSHGFCAACGTTEFLNVHHIKPFHMFPDMELDVGNLLTLCESPSHNCHFTFGHAFNWSLWNPDVVEDAKLFSERIQEARKLHDKMIREEGKR